MHLVDGALVHVGSLWLCQINCEWKIAKHRAPISHHGDSETPSTNTQ